LEQICLSAILLAAGIGAAGTGAVGQFGCGGRLAGGETDARQLVANHTKIRFDLARLNADGLQGPPDGLRALHYEYCIPDRPEERRQVAAIDPTLQVQRGSPGRMGCGAGELLCLGHTHQPGHRRVLESLVALPFVTEIREAFFE
jgi:hypothetical protein